MTCIRYRNAFLAAACTRLLQALLLLPLLACAAEHIGTVTLLEGATSLLRGTARYALAEGVRLEPGDILEVSDKAFAQLEFTDTTLIALGPRSRFMVLSFPGAGRTRDGELYLLAGWVKVERARAEPRVVSRITTPLIQVAIAATSAVLSSAASEAAIFVETGEVKVAEVAPGNRTQEQVTLKPSQFYTCKADRRCALAPRPSHAFLEGIPRNFKDTLPSRLAKFKERAVVPKRATDFTYAEVEDWINAAPPVRRAVAKAWRSKASEPAFRSAVAANLREHPEWDRILNPEKYEDAQEPSGTKTAAEPK